MKNSFAGKGLLIDGLVYLTPKEAFQLLENEAVLVDLREELFRNGREFVVKNIISMPFKTFESEYIKLPKDKLLILADYVGLNSKTALKFLNEKGYTTVASMIGGILDWVGDGMPVSINTDDELVGGCACQLRPRKPRKSIN